MESPIADESFFHVGLIVPRLEPALAEFTALLGLTWRDIYDDDVPVRNADGSEQSVRLRFAYSRQAPYLEVIEGVPDTPWALDERGSNLHHLGFYVDDLGRSAEHVTQSFCPFEVCGLGPGGEHPTSFTYHARGGLRLELVDSVARAFLSS